MMPQTTTRQAPAALPVPAPRSEQPQDPNQWVLALPGADLTLALALSDMPRTIAAQKEIVGGFTNPDRPAGTCGVLNPAGERQLMAWAAQGVQRAGGELALWQAACQWRQHNRNSTWSTPAGKAFTRRFGSQRRTQHATDWQRCMTRVFEATTVRITLTERTVDVVHGLGGLFGHTSERSSSFQPVTLVYLMSRHDARMVARHFDRALIPFVLGGYTLA